MPLVRMSYTDIYFHFAGRAPRQIFWIHWVIIIYGLIQLLPAFVIYRATLANLGAEATIQEKLTPSFIYLLVSVVVLLWPSLAIRAKRWHDRDKSAWWILINLVPVVGPLWEVIELGFLPGTVGPNRYGPDPFEQTK
jgi:uncharacterized membrane protein YhaH (DUF805 family)